MLRVISIGTDRKLFEENSAVLVRNLEYVSKMEELHIIVFSLKNLGLEPKNIGNLHIYPTNSTSRLFYVLDAFRIGKQIIENNCVQLNQHHLGVELPSGVTPRAYPHHRF